MPVGARAKKFNIVSNDHGHKHKFVFYFKLEISFLSKFGPKNENCYFKSKFGTQTNLNMQNSMEVLTFSIFDRKDLFEINVVLKLETAYVKFGT